MTIQHTDREPAVEEAVAPAVASARRPASGTAQKPRKRKTARYITTPLVLSAVVIVLFALFFVWPGLLGLFYSLTDYRGVGSFDFIGLENYRELFQDNDFYQSLGRTALYAVLYVPLCYAISLAIAVLLVNAHAKGKTLAKFIFFIPWLVSPIVTGVIWRWLFGESFGFVNFAIESMGGTGLPWSSNGNLALLVVIFASAWANTAFSMLLFIAALKNVPTSYYEAAALDGANAWQRFVHITLPGIAPTSVMVVLLTTIGGMKEFAMVQSLNGGGPGTENRLIVQYIYETGFQRAEVGYASAVSMVLMVVLLAIALIQLRFDKKAKSDF